MDYSSIGGSGRGDVDSAVSGGGVGEAVQPPEEAPTDGDRVGGQRSTVDGSSGVDENTNGGGDIDTAIAGE